MTALPDAIPELVSLADRREQRTARTSVRDAGSVTLVVAVLQDRAQAERLCDILDQYVNNPVTAGPVTGAADRVLTLGDVTMDLASLRVWLADGTSPSVTHQEFRLLRTFLEHPGQVLSRAQLMSQAWEAADAGGRRTVDVHVRRLRVKLAGSTTRITTLRGFGYRFDAG